MFDSFGNHFQNCLVNEQKEFLNNLHKQKVECIHILDYILMENEKNHLSKLQFSSFVLYIFIINIETILRHYLLITNF